jgi:hypothetical protein
VLRKRRKIITAMLRQAQHDKEEEAKVIATSTHEEDNCSMAF